MDGWMLKYVCIYMYLSIYSTLAPSWRWRDDNFTCTCTFTFTFAENQIQIQNRIEIYNTVPRYRPPYAAGAAVRRLPRAGVLGWMGGFYGLGDKVLGWVGLG